MFYGAAVENVIGWMQGLRPEWVWVMMLLVCFGLILVLLRTMGPAGLYAYIVVAVVCSNILVLKAVKFSVYDEPIALGTVLFTSTFLCTDILAEYYGTKVAKRGVYLGLVGMVLMTIFMMFGLGFQSLSEVGYGESHGWAIENHEHMMGLFMPTPVLLVAGMVAYLFSQLNDVWVFNFIKRLTKGKSLWLRNNLSTIVSAFIDNVIFSVLAWVVFAKEPMGWSTLWFTYILGTYWIRVVVALLDTPVIYAAKYFVKREDTGNL